MRHRPLFGFSMLPLLRLIPALALIILFASACNQETAQAPPIAAAEPAASATVPATDEVTRELPSGSVEEILQRANEALAANQLFEPAGSSALDYYLAAMDASAIDDSAGTEQRARRLTDAMARVDPREQIQLAIADIFPFGLTWVERAISERNRAQAKRVLALLERAQPESIALARLRDLLAQPEPPAAVETAAVASAPAAGKSAPPARTDNLPTPAANAEAVASAPSPTANPNGNQAAVSAATNPPLAGINPQANRGSASSATSAAPPASTQAQPGNANANSSRNTAASVPAAAERAPPTPVVLSQAAPRYPPRALKQRLEGWVLVGFTIRADGRVDDVSVLNAEPAGVFDREAVGSMQRWQFQPPGQAITAQRRIDFRLGR